jgi:hypothetical protein
MEEVLGAMWLISPIVLAMMACVAIGFAVTAREALGRERGLREAREQAHEDETLALTEAKKRAEPGPGATPAPAGLPYEPGRDVSSGA